MEVGAKHPHGSVVREFRGLIVLQASSGHAKGANPRSTFPLLRQQELSTSLYASLRSS
jgi:hypothetical protein